MNRKKLLLLIPVMLLAMICTAQQDSIQPPYKRFPTVPPFRVLLADSMTYFTKDMLKPKSALMIMLFNPQCDHCRHETADIIKNIDKFKKIQILMVTSKPMDSLRSFYRQFELNKYENIIVGYDNTYFLITYYQLHNMPFLAFYNKKRNLISAFEGSMPVEKILEIFD